MSAEAEDLWHVRVAPDDVKILTLEQVDDLFRLEVIDEDTQLWQEGMTEWLPLRVVAGLDDEEAPSLPPISAPPPRSPALAQTAPWPPPAAVSQRPLPPATLPPPPSARPPMSRPPAPPAPPSRAPAPASNWPSPIAATQPASNFPSPLAATQPVSSFPAPIGSSRPPLTRPPPPGSIPVPGAMRSQPPSARAAVSASFAPAPSSFMPLGVPAVAASFSPRTRTSRVELALIGLAMLAGLGVSLHRNGTVQGALASAGQTAAYENLEKSLGGPGFGTPRAVEVLVAKTPAVVEAPVVALNTTVSPSTPAPEATPEPEAKASEPGGSPLVAETALKPEKEEKVEKRAAPVRPAGASRAPAAPAPVRKASLKKSKGGNEYDPLNPNL